MRCRPTLPKFFGSRPRPPAARGISRRYFRRAVERRSHGHIPSALHVRWSVLIVGVGLREQILLEKRGVDRFSYGLARASPTIMTPCRTISVFSRVPPRPDQFATVRFSVVRPDLGWPAAPSQKVFGDHPAFRRIASGSFVEASRLCFGEQLRGRFAGRVPSRRTFMDLRTDVRFWTIDGTPAVLRRGTKSMATAHKNASSHLFLGESVRISQVSRTALL